MTIRPLLYLDIDGVLNGHDYCDIAQSCSIKGTCVGYLNWILHETNCEIIITSAWRYMVHGEAMSLSGFWYMMRTHGLTALDRYGNERNPFIRALRKDAWENEPRAKIIAEDRVWWAKESSLHNGKLRTPFVILDDLELEFDHHTSGLESHFVRTNGKSGLNVVTAKQVIELFREQMTA